MAQKFFSVLLVLAWLLFIFQLSSIPDESFGPVLFFWQGAVSHLIIYAVLAYFLYSAILIWLNLAKQKNWRIIFATVIFCLFYGITDEYHQGFVPGRSVSLADLGFDGLGGLIGALIYFLRARRQKPKLLLHVCCSGCGAYVSQLLKKNYHVKLFFYNPNIWPEDEYKKRLAEADKIAATFKLELVRGEYDHNKWLAAVRGHEADPEKGERCLICYKFRLGAAAEAAKKFNCNYLASTLTVSPHKDAPAINKIGESASEKYGLKFLIKDFKKQDGFKKSAVLSRQLGLYRQNYCGCEYSHKSARRSVPAEAGR